MEISIIGKEGFFKIFPMENRIEIVSSSFTAKGKIKLDEHTSKEMTKALEQGNSFGKTRFHTKEKEFVIEIRHIIDDDRILVLGQYEYDNHLLDFEFLSQKQEVYKCIEQIESFLKSEFTQN